jgi:hypothetical protein
VSATKAVAFAMVASFVGFFVADFFQWRTGVRDNGMNAWGTIKVLCVLANFLTWLTTAVLLFVTRERWGDGSPNTHFLVILPWMGDGLCLLLFFALMMRFLIALP